jgi:hypothetical protein
MAAAHAICGRSAQLAGSRAAITCGTLRSVRRGIIVGVGAVAGAIVAMAALVALLNVTLFVDASVPSGDDLPELPSGLRILNETEGCGSGSCYREFDIVGRPGDTPESIRSRLPVAEECSANSLVDRRPLCVGFRIGTDGVSGYVSLGKWSD